MLLFIVTDTRSLEGHGEHDTHILARLFAFRHVLILMIKALLVEGCLSGDMQLAILTLTKREITTWRSAIHTAYPCVAVQRRNT